MALVPCPDPDCGKKVSTLATACPHCGCPVSSADQPGAPPRTALGRASPPADDRGARIRAELEQFKRRFAATTLPADSPASSSGIWQQLLGSAEELLTTVCGRASYLALLDAAANVIRLHTLVENTSPRIVRRATRRQERGLPQRPHHVLYDDQYERAVEGLKRWVEGIEYRT